MGRSGHGLVSEESRLGHLLLTMIGRSSAISRPYRNQRRSLFIVRYSGLSRFPIELEFASLPLSARYMIQIAYRQRIAICLTHIKRPP